MNQAILVGNLIGGLVYQRYRDQYDQRNLDGRPHVAGAATLYLSANASAPPGQVATALTTNAQRLI